MSLSAERPIYDAVKDISERTSCRQEDLLYRRRSPLIPARGIMCPGSLASIQPRFERLRNVHREITPALIPDNLKGEDLHRAQHA